MNTTRQSKKKDIILFPLLSKIRIPTLSLVLRSLLANQMSARRGITHLPLYIVLHVALINHKNNKTTPCASLSSIFELYMPDAVVCGLLVCSIPIINLIVVSVTAVVAFACITFSLHCPVIRFFTPNQETKDKKDKQRTYYHSHRGY